MRASAGWIYLDEGEYVHHWKLRKGLPRKQAKKQYVRDGADEDASFRTVKGVRYLAVQKPFEINHEDTLTLRSKKKEDASNADMLEMAEGFGGVVKCGAVPKASRLHR